MKDIERLSPAERWQRFSAEMSRCIRCYACRQACPTCYCRECFAEQNNPAWIGVGAEQTDVSIFHIVRIFHQAGRCVECDACVRACPMGIDLRTWTKKIASDVRALYGFTPDFDPSTKPPLVTFKEDDEQEFITEPGAGHGGRPDGARAGRRRTRGARDMTMQPFVLEAGRFSAFVDAVGKTAKLFAPVADPAGGTVFAEVSSAAAVDRAAANTRLSVKSVFFPQREVLLSFKGSAVDAVPARDRNIVVFGARPCDARAMTWMDGVFGGGGREDPYFVERRRGAVVVAMACDDPCPTCFCTSVGGSPYGTDGVDVLASPAGGGPAAASGAGPASPDLLLEQVSEKGAAFLVQHASFLRPATAAEAEARAAGARAARSPDEEAGLLGREGEDGRRLRRAGVGVDHPQLPRLRRLHLRLPHLPLLRHHRRVARGARACASGRGTRASTRRSPCTPRDTTRGPTSGPGCASG